MSPFQFARAGRGEPFLGTGFTFHFWHVTIGLYMGYSSYSFSVLRSAFYVLRSAFYVLRSTFCVLRSAFYVLRSAFYVLRSAIRLKMLEVSKMFFLTPDI
jgi:hypothetical protein